MSDKHWLLFYEADDGYAERRPLHRAAHLDLVRAAVARGELLLAGPLEAPMDGSVLLFRAAKRETVEAFAVADPYVMHGVVQRWRVREWTTVMGPGAMFPVE